MLFEAWFLAEVRIEAVGIEEAAGFFENTALKSSNDASESSVSVSEPLTTSCPCSITRLLAPLWEERGSDPNDSRASDRPELEGRVGTILFEVGGRSFREAAIAALKSTS